MGPTGLIFKSKTVDFVVEKVDLKPERAHFRAVKVSLSLGTTEMRPKMSSCKSLSLQHMLQQANKPFNLDLNLNMYII